MWSRVVWLRSVFYSTIFLSLMVLINPVQAGVSGLSNLNVLASKVYLVATLNDGPAMRPVNWEIFRISDDREFLVDSFLRHSAAVSLEPGYYRAIARLDGVKRSRTFNVRTFANNNIVVAMDN